MGNGAKGPSEPRPHSLILSPAPRGLAAARKPAVAAVVAEWSRLASTRGIILLQTLPACVNTKASHTNGLRRQLPR